MYSKYSFHRRLTLRLLCIALCACMALNGCSSTSLPDDTLSSEQEETDDSVSSSEDSAYTYSDYELDDSFDRQSAASIILSGSTAQSTFPSATACIAPRKETQGTISQMSDHFPVGERAAK